jgi:hypothetical protein
LRHVHRVEHIGAIAEITAHLDFAPLGEYRTRFRLAQTLQHAADALARTTAAKINRRRFEQPHIVFIEEPMQDLRVGECA